MMSKAAVIAAVAFAAPSSAVAPCRWFKAEAGSPGPFSGSRCMSEVEHITFSSAICEIMIQHKGHDWTAEDCAAIPYNQNGDRCVAHGKQCLTPEGASLMDDEQMKSAAASCGLQSEKNACNLTDECIWVEGDFLELSCMPKQPATDRAFCRQIGAEDDCNVATPPLFSDLVEEDMYLFDAPVDNSEDQLLRGQGESKDEEVQEDEENQEDQEDYKKDQEKIQEGEDDQDELDHGVDDQDEDQEDRSMILDNALFNMVKKSKEERAKEKAAKEKAQEGEDDQDEDDQGEDDQDGDIDLDDFDPTKLEALGDIDLDDIFSGFDAGASSDTIDITAIKNIDLTDLNDAIADLDDIDLTDSGDIESTDKDSTDASAASHIAVSFLALSIAAVLISL